MKTREIAEFVGGEIHGDGETEINSVADIATALTGQIVFYEKPGEIPATNASCIIIPQAETRPLGSVPLDQAETRPLGSVPLDQAETRPLGSVPLITAINPKLSFALIAAKLHPQKVRTPEIHPSAVIAEDAVIGLGNDVFIGVFVSIGSGSKIGEGTQILAGAQIGENVSVGKNCIIHPNVVIEDGCTIGDNVILHAGVVIGADGFGYVRDENNQYIKFPQIGTVVIEDNVEIGANTCIDRGALGETRIGEGTKIDNLVQVGHNVSIGKRCVIAAQTGISGSVVIEDDCVIGGQVGFGDHVRVQSGTIIGSQAGVLPGKIVRPGVYWGTPIQPLDEYKRQNAHVKGLERLKAEVKVLKKQSQNRER
jgi:UDP-3-O-[3-hydroxymyristoyl] glucosamine N-acyltransferase